MARYIDVDKAIESIRKGAGTSMQKMFAECCLLAVPASDVAPKSEWISVDERLPTRPGAYLVFTCDRRISMCHFIDHYCDGNMQFDDYRVIHWMPLPEPPKMKGGEQK